jgi:hypothetical protein
MEHCRQLVDPDLESKNATQVRSFKSANREDAVDIGVVIASEFEGNLINGMH